MILLDTNALLWLLADAPSLGPRAREAVTADVRVLWSAVSTTEIVVKHMLGRLPMPDDLAGACATAGLTSLPFTDDHAMSMLADADLSRHDPFDRMLLAQCRSEGLTLLTSDRTLLERAVPTLDARR